MAFWQSRRERAEGLLAQSLYEDLAPAERAELDRALAQWPGLRQDADAFRRMINAVPAPEIRFQGDLLPTLRERIREVPASNWTPRRFALPAMAMSSLAVAAGITFALGGKAGNAPIDSGAQVAAKSPLEQVMADARGTLDKHEPGTALRMVRDGLAAHPSDPRAGEAQLMLADLEFGPLQRYAEAFDAYAALRSKHPQTFAAHPEAIQRLDVLTETKGDNFAPLYSVDAARDSFDELEKIIAKYPNQLVGTLAMNAMQRIECTNGEAAPGNTVTAMEAVRDRCTHPVAVAQLNLALGQEYWKKLNNPQKAREAFTAVAQSGHPPSADVARQALAQLETGDAR